MIYADSSFIVALFVRGDDHWDAAWQWWRAEGGPVLTVSRLGLFESENTIRALSASGRIRAAECSLALEGIRRAVLEGVLSRRSAAEHQLFPAATRLSQHHTIKQTFGALDSLHVAAANELGAKQMLSFDQRQRALAVAEGIAVLP